jgi:hypothetical protein
VCRVAIEQMELFLKVEEHLIRRNSHQGPLLDESWEKPTLGWIKLNCDASIDIGGKRVGNGSYGTRPRLKSDCC